MTHFVDKRTVAEVGGFKFVTEASQLRLPVGDFPGRLETDLGNGQPFLRQCAVMSKNFTEVLAVKYAQIAGCITLEVLND